VIFLHSPFSRACDRREMFAAGLELPAHGGLVLLQCLVKPEPPAELRLPLVARLLDDVPDRERSEDHQERADNGDVGGGCHRYLSLCNRISSTSLALVFACAFRSSSKA